MNKKAFYGNTLFMEAITMKKLFLIGLSSVLLATISIVSFMFTNNRYEITDEREDIYIKDDDKNEQKKDKDSSINTGELQTNISESILKKRENTITLKDDATLHFIKKYNDGSISKDEIKVPYQFYGKDKAYVQNYFDNYTLTEFTEKKAVFERKIDTESYFLIGEENGYVTVFFIDYDESVEVYERVDTPVSSLSENDQNLLKQGIRYKDKNSLFLALENYSS